MNTPDALTVNGNWRRASSSADTDLKAQTITGTHATFALPITPQPVRAAPAPTRRHHGTTDNFFGVTHLHTMRGSRHDSYRFLCHEIPPPPYPDAGLPAYSAEPNTEPITLAMYLFKFGFLFPPFWILGAIILIYPLTAPPDFEPTKSEMERRQLMQIIRNAELRWAKRCTWALVALLVLGSFTVSITLGVLRSES